MESNNIPAWAHEKLERRASKAILFLQQLTSAQQVGEGSTKNPTMPKSAVVSSQGIAILSRNKYGAFFTVENEYGFLIKKISGPRGSVRWSAPVFLRGSFMGAGFTGGYTKYRTCVALANEQAVESALRGRSSFGPSIHFLLDMNGTRIRRARFDSNDVGTAYEEDKYGGKTANYYQVEAAMVDVSIHGGGSTVDKDFNAAVYGRETTVEEILSGSITPPKEFELLYTILQQFVEQTPGSRRREPISSAGGRSIKPVRSIKMSRGTSPGATPESPEQAAPISTPNSSS